tara:strand:+ start:183 stop:818 length:636 start_codon:yes stop_codon:yes gene_type:complete
MKNSIIAGLSLCGLFLFGSCQEPSQKTDETPTAAPSNIISLADANFLYQNYTSGNVPLLEDALQKDTTYLEDGVNKRATRSLFIPYDQLKQYLKYIEQQSDSANVDITGLRIYLGKYASNGKYPNGKPSKYRAVSTVFLNPTAKFPTVDGGKDDVSYAIISSEDGNKTAVPVGKLLKSPKPESGLGGGDTISLSLNDSTRRPPPDNDINDF